MPLGTASQRFFSPPRRVLPITPPRWPHASTSHLSAIRGLHRRVSATTTTGVALGALPLLSDALAPS